MFDLNNNNISTFLLLIVLGLLIWYLTKPNNENFTNNNIEPITQPNMMAPEPQQFIGAPINVPSMLQPVQQPITQPRMMAPITQPTMMAPITQPLMMVPTTEPPIVAPTTQPTINNFEAYDDIGDFNGADIITAFQAPVPTTNTVISSVDINKQNIHNYNAKDFLPKEINDQWFDTDFSQAKTNISDDKLINTDRYVIGINTVGQSLKNASYDIRGTIANPKFSVSPWNNSTYEPDYNIKPLC